ncbi:aminotransferase [Pleomorphomonas diazotrophica]|uniref:cysteine-S-conjugate beta-lyase n=1 Tax=Pleomorphomonas diazotrophica TaxID=1166257 RepID=A0A1I4SXI6_9HYPH|nr:PatB family C-S lyase [Pleomorphomonas diazotrophica]PKR88682.1 aminotransferase [Pleomorphomonas diazotrophica]SFM69172.1 cystathione beta-lyase [Pleomorphomonas diazotrophica]
MAAYDFDTVIDRRQVPTSKWDRYPEDVLPMWVADMDFSVAEPIAAALRDRLEHPVFGYGGPGPASLRDLIAEDMRDLYGWTISPADVVFLPGVVPGFNQALKAIAQPGDSLVIETPVYPPILAAAGHWDLNRVDVPVLPVAEGSAVDVDRLTGALAGAAAFLLCNPHNPTGRVRTRTELEAVAEASLSSGAVIISDEIHCDIVYGGARHIPVAALSPEVARRTITLMAASKTYNIAGLKTAYAIIPDADLRRRFVAANLGMSEGANVLGLVATEAALRHGRPWKQALLSYLEANRDHLVARLARELPGIRLNSPEATYLAWLDCSALELGDAYRFFLDKAKVAFNPGPSFGGDDHHVRLNFGCPRTLLDEGIDRMVKALSQR